MWRETTCFVHPHLFLGVDKMSELWLQARAVAAAIRLTTRQLLALGLVFGLILGLGSGLFFGWIVWPVGYAGEVSVSQAIYVEMVSELFAYNLDQDRVRRAMDWPDAAAVTCTMMRHSADEGRRVRLWMVLLVMGEDCDE